MLFISNLKPFNDLPIPKRFVDVAIPKTHVARRRSALTLFGLIKEFLMAASAREVYGFCVNSARARQPQIIRHHVQLISKFHTIFVLLPIRTRIGEMDKWRYETF